MVAEMPRSPLADAFAHHVWATIQLIDVSAALSEEQLESVVPGVYGSILETFRHLVASDRGYLTVHPRVSLERVDEETLSLSDARTVIQEDGREWARIVAELDDPDRILIRHRPNGSENRAPAGIRLAQALQHGTDHRSQICTILTTLGIEPPDIDVWEFATQDGRTEEIPAPSA